MNTVDVTEREVAEDLIQKLRDAGFNYPEKFEDATGEPYPTDDIEISTGKSKINRRSNGWEASYESDNGGIESLFSTDYDKAAAKFVEFVKREYPDRLKS